jgi:hypothetical protein
MLACENHLREEVRSDRLLPLLLLVEVALLLLPELLSDLTVALRLAGELCCVLLRTDVFLLLPAFLSGLTVAFRLLEELRFEPTAASRLLLERVAGASLSTFALRFVLERSTVPALLVLCVLRSLVAGFTVAERSVLLLVLLFRTFSLAVLLVLLLVLLVLSIILPRLVADLLVVDLTSVPLSLDRSGRYTLTALLLTLVDLPERLFVLSSLCTVAVLPVVRS